MKKTTAKIIQISDILQWHEKGELELSPKYQRNSVWNEKAKTYLIDTIVRGLPIPPIFVRQKIDVDTKKTFREIIDGQQRLRTIIEYIIEEKFAIKKSHNKELGNKKYSDLDDEIKESVLAYEIIAEVVTEKEDATIYDMFARLNSNNMVLNRQELRNARYWGEYKVFIYRLASLYRRFFIEYGIFSDNDFARMKDIEFVSSLAIVLTEGIENETPNFVDSIYEKYDMNFLQLDEIESKFELILNVMSDVYNYLNNNASWFGNKNYFFTLFCAIADQMYQLPEVDAPRSDFFLADNIGDYKSKLINIIIKFIHDYDKNVQKSDSQFAQFSKHHKVRTTSKTERIERIRFLSTYIGSDADAD